MKFLIIGASGFVGRHALSYVSALGYEALGTRSRDEGDGLLRFDLLEHRIKDRMPPSWLETGEPVFGVIAAAITQIDRCLRERELSGRVNVDGTIRLVEDLAALGVKPVYLSSSFVYDGSVGYYPEDAPCSPVSVYGEQKAAVERHLREHRPEALILRLDKLVGDEPSERHLFAEWWRWMNEGHPITCIQDQVFAPTFVTDIAKAIVLGCGRGLSGVYHVANPEFFTRAELASQFVLAARGETSIVCRSQAALNFLDRRPLRSYLDSTKFVTATGMRFTSMREVFTAFLSKCKPAWSATAPQDSACLGRP